MTIKRKKDAVIKKAVVVIALVMGSMMLTTPAMADEPAEVTTEQAAPEPAPEVAPEPESEVKKTKPPKDDEPDHKESVCHPVAGKGELGNGWNLIPPDKHSSHIDDEGNPKHEHDGRVDIISLDGTCPGDPIPHDECPNIPGDQPEGTDCNPPPPPPHDECPNIPGDQPEGTDCNPPPPPTDACPDIPGDQPEGTDCTPEEPPVEEPPVEEPPTTEPPSVERTAILPNTGAESNLVAMGLLALAMMVLGGGSLVASRVRK